jgi:hypothetical protein
MSRLVAALQVRRNPYRRSFTPLDNTVTQGAYSLPMLNKRDDFATDNPEASELPGETSEKTPYKSFSSKSLGMDISSTLSRRLLKDSSSKDMEEVFRHASNEGTVRKTPRSASSLSTG